MLDISSQAMRLDALIIEKHEGQHPKSGGNPNSGRRSRHARNQAKQIGKEDKEEE